MSAVTVAFAAFIPGLRIDSTMATVFPQDDPELAAYQAFKRQFGEDEFIVVALQTTTGDVLAPEVVGRIRTITEEIAGLPTEFGVARVASLTSVDDVRSSPEGLVIQPLVTDGAPLDQARRRLLSNPLYLRNLVSSDLRSTAINVALHDRPRDPQSKERLFTEIRRVVEDRRGPLQAHYAGIPVLTAYTGQWLRRDMAIFIPATLLVIAGALLSTFRSWAGVFLPLSTVGLAVVWTVGFITASGRSISILSSIVPSLLIAIGVAYSIHVLAHAADPRRVRTAVALSALTTAVGFAALMVNDVRQIQEFGLFCAFGIASAAILALYFVPAVIALLPTPSRTDPPGRRTGAVMSRLADLAVGSPGAVIAVAGALVLAGGWGIARLEVDTDYSANFSADSEPVRALRFMRQHLSGERPINVVLTSRAREPGGIVDPGALHVLEQVEAALRAHPQVATTLSVGDYLRNLDAALRGLPPGQGALPSSRAAADQLLLLYDRPAELGRFLTPDRRALNVLGRSSIISSREYLRFVKRLRSELGPVADAAGLDLQVTGSMYLLSKTSVDISVGQARSLAVATGLIFVIMTLLFRSIRLGLLALLPNALPIAMNFAAMGALGVTLNMGTAIMASMALGVAVDDTIHFLVAYRRERAAGQPSAAAVRATLQGAGRHIVFTSLTNAAGFLVLTLSSFTPLAALGWLTALTMLTAMLADLVLLPALLVSFDRTP